MSNDKECFVVSPIGPETSETRERADKLLEHVIRDTVKDLGYETVRADELDEPGQISVQVIQHTVNADLVIADLTGENPNVFYELAIRHATHNPFLQIIEKGNNIPFDISDQRTIKIDIQDLDSVDTAQSEIENQIKNIESGDHEVDSPVSTAMNLQFWEESGDPQQQELAEITELMTDMRSEIDKIQFKMEEMTGSGIPTKDIQRIVDIHDKTEEMEQAIKDIKNMVEPVEFGTIEEQQDMDNAVSFLQKSIRETRSDADKFLQKHY